MKWGSGRGKGQGQAGGRARSEAKLGYPELFFFSRKRSNTDQKRGLLDTHEHLCVCVRARARKRPAIMKPAADVSLMSATLQVFMQSVASY